MATDNPVFMRLVAAITPIVSIGVGSAVVSVCSKKGLTPDTLETKDLPGLKDALVAHYERFWAQKIGDIRTALSQA